MATWIRTRRLCDWWFYYLTFRSSLQSMNLYLTWQINSHAFYRGGGIIESCSPPLQQHSLCPIWHAWGQLCARLWTCTTVAASSGVTAHQTHLGGCGESEAQSHPQPSSTITHWFIKHNRRRQMTDPSRPALSACNPKAGSLLFSIRWRWSKSPAQDLARRAQRAQPPKHLHQVGCRGKHHKAPKNIISCEPVAERWCLRRHNQILHSNRSK